MSTIFERFVEMAKEEFGYTVIPDTHSEFTTFESLFGVSGKDFTSHELPYNVSVEQFIYYDKPTAMNLLGLTSTNNFSAEKQHCFAA